MAKTSHQQRRVHAAAAERVAEADAEKERADKAEAKAENDGVAAVDENAKAADEKEAATEHEAAGVHAKAIADAEEPSLEDKFEAFKARARDAAGRSHLASRQLDGMTGFAAVHDGFHLLCDLIEHLQGLHAKPAAAKKKSD